MIAALVFQTSGSGDNSAVDPSQVTGWDIALAAAVVVLAIPLGSIVGRITIRTARRVPNLPEPIVQDLGRMGRWAVYLIAFALALTFLGVTVGWLSIVVVVILILGVLMVKPMVENIAAGLLMTMRPSFSVDDQIQTDKYRGIVKEIGSRTTILDTSDGISIHIPNVEVAGEVIEVYSAYDHRRSSVSFNVDFATDLNDLTERLLKSMAGIDLVEDEPPPTVQASGIDEGAITVKVGFWYPSSQSSESAPMDEVVRSIQSTLSDTGITPVTGRLDIQETMTTVNQQSVHSTQTDDAGASDN